MSTGRSRVWVTLPGYGTVGYSQVSVRGLTINIRLTTGPDTRRAYGCRFLSALWGMLT